MEKALEEFKIKNQEACNEASVELWAAWCEGEESWME